MAIDFPISALPYCVFSDSDSRRRLAVGVGTDLVDLRAAAGRFTAVDPSLLRAEHLNPLLAAGSGAWSPLRDELLTLAGSGALDEFRRPQEGATLHLAWDVVDYVDFYSSRHHAENVGRIFRPDDPSLPENWLHLPAGYHGRSATVVVDGTPIRRPRGQLRAADGGVELGPTRMLDFELEIGFVVGGHSALGEPVAASEAGEHLFGVVLLDDWSARDIQAWEYVPLGPFLGKSFATSVSAWVMPMAALADARRPGPAQDPVPLEYLRTTEQWALDIDLEAWLRPAGADRGGLVTTVNAAEGLYWNPAQQLAHLTVNGARLSPGDLLGSGTVSGPRPDQMGSLLEASRGGASPIAVGAHTRGFLEDGDEVTMRATANGAPVPIPLGPVRGSVLPA